MTYRSSLRWQTSLSSFSFKSTGIYLLYCFAFTFHKGLHLCYYLVYLLSGVDPYGIRPIGNQKNELLSGGAGGLEHIRPELQISRGRIFLTTSIMELTQC